MITNKPDDLIKLIQSFFLFLLISAAETLQAGEPVAFYRENFNGRMETAWETLPEGWWLEGASGGARTRIHEGRLWLDAKGPHIQGATVWLDKIFDGDIEVSFDVHVVAAKDNVNNMNFFFMFRDPDKPELRAGSDERADGRYAHYHSGRLHGTILTFLANPDNRAKARVRVRQVPPFNPVLQEFNGYHARTGQTYRVTIARRGSRLTSEIDGQRVIDVRYPRPEDAAQPGAIGFRTWQTELWWDNVVIRRPQPDQVKSLQHPK